VQVAEDDLQIKHAAYLSIAFPVTSWAHLAAAHRPFSDGGELMALAEMLCGQRAKHLVQAPTAGWLAGLLGLVGHATQNATEETIV
jgi:hypothetical protein